MRMMTMTVVGITMRVMMMVGDDDGAIKRRNDNDDHEDASTTEGALHGRGQQV